MEYVKFNGQDISKITLGTVQLGMNYGINNSGGKPSEETANKVLASAIKGGITAFDTSSAYGTSEQVLGNYFSKRKENPMLITKFRVMNYDNPLSNKQAEKVIVDQVENSLKNLGLNQLPLLLMHNETDLDVYGDVVIKTLKNLQKDKLVSKLGVSLNHFSYVDKVINNQIFEAVQIPLNMMDVKNATSGVVKKLADNGICVFVRSVFLQGLFFRDPDTLPSGVLQMAKEPLKRIRKIAQEENVTVAGLAIAYIRDLEGVSSLVMGAEKPEQVEENISLINVKKLSYETREKITNTFKDVDERVLQPWLWNK